MLSSNPVDDVEHFVTLFDNNFLPSGLCLHSSLLEHGQPFHLWIICIDELVELNLRRLALAHVTLLPLRAVEDERLLAVKPTRTRVEYCWTLTPFAPQFVFDLDPQVRRVTYLDADLYFFASPKILLDEFVHSEKHVLITDHSYGLLCVLSGIPKRSGKFCVQFMTFRRTVESFKVMHWWQERCLEWCYARVEDGKFGDQKYLDQWPTLFGAEVHILMQKEKTLAPWNVADFEKLGNGRLDPVFYHFHSFRIISANELLLYTGHRIGYAAKELYAAYVSALGHVVDQMDKSGIAVPCLPRRGGLRARLAALRYQFMGAEKSMRYR